MTAIPLEVLILQVTSSCSQDILVIFGEVAAGVSSGPCTGIGRMWDSSRSSTFYMFQGIFPSDSRSLEYCPSRIQGGGGVVSQEAFLLAK